MFRCRHIQFEDVTTLHGRLDLPELTPVFEAFPDVAVVSISDHQRRGLPEAHFVGTVHHDLPAGLLMPREGVIPRYLAFLGRIAPEKGPERAIRIARACGIPLKIAAKLDRADQSYFDTVIRPMLGDGGVEMVGEISDAEKLTFLSGAVAAVSRLDQLSRKRVRSEFMARAWSVRSRRSGCFTSVTVSFTSTVRRSRR